MPLVSPPPGAQWTRFLLTVAYEKSQPNVHWFPKYMIPKLAVITAIFFSILNVVHYLIKAPINFVAELINGRLQNAFLEAGKNFFNSLKTIVLIACLIVLLAVNVFVPVFKYFEQSTEPYLTIENQLEEAQKAVIAITSELQEQRKEIAKLQAAEKSLEAARVKLEVIVSEKEKTETSHKLQIEEFQKTISKMTKELEERQKEVVKLQETEKSIETLRVELQKIAKEKKDTEERHKLQLEDREQIINNTKRELEEKQKEMIKSQNDAKACLVVAYAEREQAQKISKTTSDAFLLAKNLLNIEKDKVKKLQEANQQLAIELQELSKELGDALD